MSEDCCSDVREATPSLSPSQLERIKRNRERAKSIRQARLQSKPYDLTTRRQQPHVTPGQRREEERRKLESWVSGVCSKSSAGRDTGGGFLLEEDEEQGATVGGRGLKTVEDDGQLVV
ncbi:hypothetical protein GBAR_LOCUS27971 [Geodia barretti]|uniref:Uncharacterized protein n=1 Tax=Geodia barretti TaxID=519541 RepID=A0AA35TMH5_GEOBA|nr:hypothetical protein GBAR_LOCUS27971 [Geodia barretti]